MSQGRIRALVPITHGSEDIEVVSLCDVLSRGSVEVIVASLDGTNPVHLMKGTKIQADCGLGDLEHESFEAICIPGGVPGAMHLGQSDLLRAMIQAHHKRRAVVAAICLAPALVLLPSGVLDQSEKVAGNPLQIKTPERTYAPDHFTAMLGDAFDPSTSVCVDPDLRLVTSQLPGTTIDFALEIVAMLRDPEAAEEIRRYIQR